MDSALRDGHTFNNNSIFACPAYLPQVSNTGNGYGSLCFGTYQLQRMAPLTGSAHQGAQCTGEPGADCSFYQCPSANPGCAHAQLDWPSPAQAGLSTLSQYGEHFAQHQ